MASWLVKYGPEISILISLCAFILSSFTLGWNIYRDVILKARLPVEFSATQTLQPGRPPGKPFLCLSITNLGPGNVVCNMSVIQTRPSWMRFVRHTDSSCDHLRLYRSSVLQATFQVGGSSDRPTHISDYRRLFFRSTSS